MTPRCRSSCGRDSRALRAPRSLKEPACRTSEEGIGRALRGACAGRSSRGVIQGELGAIPKRPCFFQLAA
eukprot:2729412-Pleurochrysis_carterae.AAC.1